MSRVDQVQQVMTGYRIIQEVYASSRTVVYRGIRFDDHKPVILKTLRDEYPSFNELLKFRNQYTITKNINLPGIIQTYDLEPYGNRYILVMEDFGGISLSQFTQRHPLDLTTVLIIAIQLADILHELYQNRVIHKDIKPANILIHPETKQVKLIDFSISSLLPRETQEIQNPNILEGTLAYISPEQTGRMNRGIDYRTDFYALGVTLFELLTGQLPFNTENSMELVYSHLAKTPPAVTQKREDIPPVISDIVIKLMAKNAEDRYQNALGLKQDLQQCLTQWKETGKIANFAIAKHDKNDRFIIPEKLYGRQEAVDQLLAAFNRVSSHSPEKDNKEQRKTDKPQETPPQSSLQKGGRSEMMLVAGFSGVGKTAVINEVHKPITRSSGYFIQGKFDQFNRNIPFSAFVQAFRSLICQLLSEPDTSLAHWKAKILNAVGAQGQVLIDVIPELEHIIGQQPAVPELSGIAVENRFHLLFSQFVHVFCTKEHPLVIFLDDLQWADSASLNLLKLLINGSETSYLLILGAYRNNEVLPAHPLQLTLDEITKQGAIINQLTLAPLTLEDTNNLVADALLCSANTAKLLAQLVHQKAGGNPFFITQFLKGLHQEGYITFNIDAGYWQCDLTQIRQLSLTDNVVEFMVEQLQKLPKATQNVLKLAACIGNRFNLETLAVVCEETPAEVATDLWQALQEGFVIPENETYKFFQGCQGEETNVNNISVNYRFLHDRVQQAAYSLIPEAQKQTTHYHIGQLLLQQTSPSAIEEHIFEVVNQLNYGIALITEQTEKDQLAQLNLIACRKARVATAYQAGREYASLGLSILGKKAWETQYKITLEFHELAAELASLCGDFEAMEQFVETVIEQAKSLLEQVNIYRIKIRASASQSKLTEAIDIAPKFLKQLDITFPETPTQTDIQDSIAEINHLIGKRKIEALVDLPVMTDRKKIAITQMITSILPAAYISGDSLFPLLVTSSVKLSIQFGNILTSALAYACYGILNCTIQQEVETGVKFGQLALQLVSKLDAKAMKPEILNTVSLFLLHRKSHLKDTLTLSQEGYTAALEVGNLEYLGYCANVLCFHSFLCGQPLASLAQETRAYYNTLVQLKQLTAANWCRIHLQMMLNLLSVTENPTILFGDATQEKDLISQLIVENHLAGLGDFYLYKIMLCFLFEEIESAQESIVEFKKSWTAATTKVSEAIFYFYDSLTALAGLSSTSSQKKEILQSVEKNQTKLQQQWASHAPMNYQHKVDLVEAEKCRVLGQKTEAIELYDKAIAGAKANQYIQEEALANELAAKFYLNWGFDPSRASGHRLAQPNGKEKVAAGYMQEAYYCYSRWGAKAKVTDLEKRYPQLLQAILQSPDSEITPEATIVSNQIKSFTNTSSNQTDWLDLPAILQAAQAISQEIELEKLLKTLLQIAVTNAGAEKGHLILCQDEQWLVRAEAYQNQAQQLEVTLEQYSELPQSLIYLVARTQEVAVFENLGTVEQFAKDHYVTTHQPQSVLCLPMSRQGKLVGILYLENNLTTGAFTHDRVEVLNLLMSQAAISVENARLYQKTENYSQTLEIEVERKTKDLNQKAQDLEQALKELQKTQAQLIHTEKMSSLGQMVAGIAHEINNPIGFIKGNLTHTENYLEDLIGLISIYEEEYPQPSLAIQEKREEIELDFLLEDAAKIIQSMKAGSDRISQITLSLRNFSRLDESPIKSVDLHSGIESTLLILQNRLQACDHHPEIKVIKEYGNLPEITCYPSQLNQVFLNIITNGIDAIREHPEGSESPEIRIRTEVIEDKKLRIAIANTNSTIPIDIQNRIFDPFFTTKPVGKGTGLGLFVSYSIIQKHGGTLNVRSQPGEGTEFEIVLPCIAQ